MRLLFKAVGFASQKTLFSSELWSDQYWTVLKEDEAPDRSSVISIAKKTKKNINSAECRGTGRKVFFTCSVMTDMFS